MKWSELLDNWSLSSLSLNAVFLNMEWQPNEQDKQCAWELYVELLTRITTQRLDDKHGDETTALESIYALFAITRDILKNNGRHCKEFTRISIIVLNQIVRPFSAKWHKHSISGELTPKTHPELCKEFRSELSILQDQLMNYSRLLADMAGVEDLTTLKDNWES